MNHKSLNKFSPTFILAAFVVGFSGCGGGLERYADSAPLPASLDVRVASLMACPNGGMTVTQYIDINFNQVLDANEQILNANSICNGAVGQTGQQGIGAGISVSAADDCACPAGGSVITTFIDYNNNGALNSDETVTSRSTVCNGMNGRDGMDGSNGSNGTSSQITVTAATPAQCSAGGQVYTISNTGMAPTVTVVCNGTNGNNGSDGKDGRDGEDGKDGKGWQRRPERHFQDGHRRRHDRGQSLLGLSP